MNSGKSALREADFDQVAWIGKLSYAKIDVLEFCLRTRYIKVKNGPVILKDFYSSTALGWKGRAID